MTEQQIKNLKTILNISQRDENSPALDDKILDLARAKTRQKEIKSKRFMSFDLFVPAVFSIMLTLGMFVGLGYVLTVEESSVEDRPSFLVDQKNDVERNYQAEVSVVVETTNFSNVQINEIEPYPQTTFGKRDQILTKLVFPNTEILLDSMEFAVSRDHDLAKNAIAQAMTDIHVMIGDGELNNARQRYERLRRLCVVCTLPRSLEALALNETAPLDSG